MLLSNLRDENMSCAQFQPMKINLFNWNFNSLIESGFAVPLRKTQAFNCLLETTTPTKTAVQV